MRKPDILYFCVLQPKLQLLIHTPKQYTKNLNISIRDFF